MVELLLPLPSTVSLVVVVVVVVEVVSRIALLLIWVAIKLRCKLRRLLSLRERGLINLGVRVPSLRCFCRLKIEAWTMDRLRV